MASVSILPPARLGKLPANAADMLLARGDWTWCAMEHSRIGAIELAETGVPFHHLALPLERRPLRFTFAMDGRRQHGRNAPDMVAMIRAGTVGWSHWDAELESACLYFDDAALAQALGLEKEVRHEVRTRPDHHSPVLARLLRALCCDASAGQPHGRLVGDAIFMAIAARLVPPHSRRRTVTARAAEPWRVRNALAFIHAELTGDLSIAKVADAAATSPFYLNHAFQLAVGCSIWRYVLGERARYAARMMGNGSASLAAIAQAAGFKTYPSFIDAIRKEFGQTPDRLRHALGGEAGGSSELP